MFDFIYYPFNYPSGTGIMNHKLYPVFIALILMTVFAVVAASAEIPREIAGFRLGGKISDYKDSILPETALPVRHSEFLSEVDVKPPAGYKSGYITYGNCDQSERIVRIKLKYEREDKEFFNDLLERFKEKFGNPPEYKGDAFRACLAWKWNFNDSGTGEKIGLLLEYNCEQDEDINTGNSIKLIYRSAIEKERSCFEKKYNEAKQGENPDEKTKGKPDFRSFVPN
jgi:hypothetical protein